MRWCVPARPLVRREGAMANWQGIANAIPWGEACGVGRAAASRAGLWGLTL